MTIDTFVQVIALIVAIYALIPRARQLGLRIHIGNWEVVVGIFYFLVIVYLLFYDTFLNLGLAQEWQWDDNPSFTSFWITILFIIFSLWRLQLKNLPRKSIFKFQELAESLLHREEYSELITLLDRYWEALLKIYFGSTILLKLKFNLESRIILLSPEKELEKVVGLNDAQLRIFVELLEKISKPNQKEKKRKIGTPKTWKIQEKLRLIARTGIRWIVKAIPDYQIYSEAAGDLIRIITTNKSFIEALSRIRPYFVIRLLENKDFPQHAELLDLYLKSLLRNPQSVLYTELADIRRSSRKRDIDLPKSDRLLCFLLDEASRANRLSVWKPIGDEVLRFLEERSAFPEKDSYNFPVNDFGGVDIEIEQSPLYAGIHFFDIMVTRAMYQGVKSHMWLYYFHHFVEKIVQNYSPHSSVDFSREFPDRYTKFLSEIINIYEDWIGSVKDPVLSAQSHIAINRSDDPQDDWKIPKSSIIDLGFSLERILMSQKFQDKYKIYWMDSIFRLYFELRNNPVTEDYGKALFAMLKGKGIGGKKEFRDVVMNCFKQVDQIPYRMQYRELFDEFLKT